MRFLVTVLILVASSALAQSVVRFALTAQDVQSAVATVGPAGQPGVYVQLNKTAAAKFERLTCANVGKQLEVLVEGRVVLKAKVQSCISNGAIQITGNFTVEETEAIARSLKQVAAQPVAASSDSSPTPSSQNIIETMLGWVLELLQKLFRR